MAQQVALLDDLQHPQRHGRGHGMPGIGRGMRHGADHIRRPFQHIVEFARHHDGGDRLVRRRQRLGQAHAVRREAEGLGGEHVPGAAKPGDYLVIEHLDAVAVQHRAQPGHVAVGRQHASGGIRDGIKDHRPHRLRARPLDRLLDLQQHAPGELRLALALQRRVDKIRLADRQRIIHRQVERRRGAGKPAQCRRRHGAAVIAAGAGDHLGALGFAQIGIAKAHELDQEIVRLRPRRGKRHPRILHRRHRRQLLAQRQRGGHRAVNPGGVGRQVAHLPDRRLDQVLVGKPQRRAIERRGALDELAPVLVNHEDAAPALDHHRPRGARPAQIGETDQCRVVRRVVATGNAHPDASPVALPRAWPTLPAPSICCPVCPIPAAPRYCAKWRATAGRARRNRA